MTSGNNGHTNQILLLQPWIEDFYATDCRMFPLGLAYLAGSLKNRFPDFDVRIYDTFSGGGKSSLPWPREFAYLKPYFGYQESGPFALFHQFFRFGQTDAAIEKRLKSFRPFLIGISCLFTPYYRQSLALGKLCRKVFGRTPIVMGGSHATLHPETLLFPHAPFKKNENLCDYVLRGECETSLCELAEHLLGLRPIQAVSNLVSREELMNNAGNRVSLPKLKFHLGHNKIPPDFTGLIGNHYLYNKRPMRFVSTSRSCPYSCSFCSVHSVFGSAYNKRRPKDVLSEINRGIQSGIQHFDIEDDNFTHDKAHCLAVLNGIQSLGKGITLSAMNGLNYHSLDDQILSAMKQAGFESLNLSLVSVDLNGSRYGRPHSLKKFTHILALAAANGLRVVAYIILGFPGQGPESMWASLKYLSTCRCLIGPSPFYFTPGTAIHAREAHKPGVRLASRGKDPLFSARLTAMDYEDELVNREDVFTCFKLCRVLNHVKKGLDKSLPADAPWFNCARETLRTGSWRAQSKKGAYTLPFSQVIHRMILKGGVEVRGYRTENHMRLL